MKKQAIRGPAAKAMTVFFFSKEGVGCMDESILKPNGFEMVRFLRNRLQVAYLAGYAAGERARGRRK